MANIESSPFSAWLEDVLRELYDIEPACIAMEMRDSDGRVYTSYWQIDSNDRACIIDAMQDDKLVDFFRNNKDMILEILNEEDEDGLCEPNSETDSTG